MSIFKSKFIFLNQEDDFNSIFVTFTKTINVDLRRGSTGIKLWKNFKLKGLKWVSQTKGYETEAFVLYRLK